MHFNFAFVNINWRIFNKQPRGSWHQGNFTYHQILKSNETSVITLRSPSGDTDIVVLTVALLYEFRNRVLIDDGSGDSRNVMQISNIDIEKDLVGALIGFHSLTRND